MANILLASLSFLDTSLQSSDSTVSIPVSKTSVSNSERPNITIIGTTTFMCASKLPDSHNFKLCLYSLDIQVNSVKQKLLICPMFLPSIINLPMFSGKLKLKFSLFIILMTSKSIWKRVLNIQLALYTLFQHLNKRLWRNSLRKILTWVLSNQPHLHMVHWSYLLKRKMVHYAFVSTSIVLTTSPRRIAIHSCSSPTY